MQRDRSTRSRDGTPPSRGRAGEQPEALLDALARPNPLRQVVQVADGPAIADGVRAAAHAGQVPVVAASTLL
jgi:hypothetical protein